MKLTLTALLFVATTASCQTIDFTRGLPPGVQAVQPTGTLIPQTGACSIAPGGTWYLPWVLAAGDYVDVTLNTRYPQAEGFVVDATKLNVTRYTFGAATVRTIRFFHNGHSVLIGLPEAAATFQVRAEPQVLLGFWNGGTNTSSNTLKLLSAKIVVAPTPTPTATLTPMPTITPAPRPTPDYRQWFPVWRKIKDSQDVVVWERWLVEPGATLVRIESATVFPATVDLRVGPQWSGNLELPVE